MKSILPFLALVFAVSSCDRQPAVQPAILEFAQGAIQVRQLESADRDEMLFEIDISSTGMLTVALGPSRLMGLPISTVPDKRVLRVVREELEGDTILNQFVRPLFGEDAAQQLRNRDPEADGRKLVMTTLIVTSESGSARTGPSATLIPWSLGGSTSVGLRSGALDEPRARLAAWLHVPHTPGVQPLAVGIGLDGPRLLRDGDPVTVEQAGAVFTELTLEFRPENSTVVSN